MNTKQWVNVSENNSMLDKETGIVNFDIAEKRRMHLHNLLKTDTRVSVWGTRYDVWAWMEFPAN